jgi:OmpA-OmpF porin, OOP family
MKKLSVLILAVSAFSFGSFAQAVAVNLNVGTRFMGNVSESSTLSTGFHMNGGVTYMINDKLGIKGDMGYDAFSADNIATEVRDRSFMIRGSVQGVLSLSNLFDFETSDFSMLFHAGFGFASNYNPSWKENRLDNGVLFGDPGIKGNDDMINIIFGLTPQYRIKDNWFANFDISGVVLPMESNFVDRAFDATSTQGTGFILNTSVGVTYVFGKGKSARMK